MMNRSRTIELHPNPRTIAVATLVLLASMLQLSCGFSVAVGGTSGTGFSKGPIEDFGSIVVGDVHWNVKNAEIEFDGEVIDVPQVFGEEEVDAIFDLGQVVTVEGELHASGVSGDATRVSFDDAVEGAIIGDPIVVVPGLERELNVLGRTVVITPTIDYTGGASFADLAKEDVVEVSGLVDGDVIYATWIDLVGPYEQGVTQGELHGVVEDLSTSGGGDGEFEIGDVKVSFTAGTELEGFDGAPLVEGQFVEAAGVLTGLDEIDADRIELESAGLPIENAENVEITGIVAGFVDLASPFTVSGVEVDASGASVEGALADGVEVEVEGDLVASVLVAEEMKVEEDD